MEYGGIVVSVRLLAVIFEFNLLKVVFYFQAVDWIKLFVSLSGKAMGYEKERITPYMHAMVYHVPKFMEVHKGIKKFTGQGNDKTVKNYLIITQYFIYKDYIL